MLEQIKLISSIKLQLESKAWQKTDFYIMLMI